MDHFSNTTLTYIDATLGWPFYTGHPRAFPTRPVYSGMNAAHWSPSPTRPNCSAARFASSPRSTSRTARLSAGSTTGTVGTSALSWRPRCALLRISFPRISRRLLPPTTLRR
jgi:hypothetical protein